MPAVIVAGENISFLSYHCNLKSTSFGQLVSKMFDVYNLYPGLHLTRYN